MFLYPVFISLQILLFCTNWGTANPIQMIKKPFHRLPTFVVPLNYKLKIFTNLSSFTFSGEENVAIDVKNQTSSIVMNSLNLKVKNVIFHQDRISIPANEVKTDNEEALLTLNFPEILPLGKSSLTFQFEGNLTDNMRGYYRSKYTDDKGKEHIIASTQFESTDARRAFPCWDEPALKATFDISLVTPKNKVVLSNTNIIEKKEKASFDTYTFATTPIMSTYLVAFIIGDFDCITKQLENGLKVSVYTRVGKSYMGQFALDVACKTVPFYEEYFRVSYPLPKLDLVAIPDFAAGAMENWGLITYREITLLVDDTSSAQATQYVALVVGHEIAHQWFGNLVTMEWWTHLWLNEGFARWVEYISVDHCFPTYLIWKDFVKAERANALELDGLRNSHPIEIEVGHPSEIDEIFDDISYSKGASVINMLQDFIGHYAFAEGLTNYLRHFSYKNAKTTDLWKFLSEATNKSIENIMGTWTSQMGYPIITVSQKIVNDGVNLSLSQERFISDGGKSEEYMKWAIPLSLVTSENPDSPIRLILDEESIDTHIVLSRPPKWIRLNYGQIGFYRVKYSDQMFSDILLNLNIFTPVERFGVLNDAFALARSGSMQTTKFLDLAVSLYEEKDNIVWGEVSSSLSTISNLVFYSKASEQNIIRLNNLISNLAEPIYQYVGLNKSSSQAGEETHHVLLLRSIVVEMLTKARNPELLNTLRTLCNLYISRQEVVAPDIRLAMFYALLSSNKESDFMKLIEYYKHSTEIEEKILILRSMSALTHPDLIENAMKLSISEHVRLQDTATVLGSVASNPAARSFVWEFLKKNWNILVNRYGGGQSMPRLLKDTISGFADIKVLNDIKDYFEKNPSEVVARALKQGLEKIQNNVRWLERDEESITSWLRKH